MKKTIKQNWYSSGELIDVITKDNPLKPITRTCRKCNLDLPIDRFVYDGPYKRHTCKKCTNKRKSKASLKSAFKRSRKLDAILNEFTQDPELRDAIISYQRA